MSAPPEPLPPALAEYLAGVIPGEAAAVHRSYSLVPAEDIEQEMWASALARQEALGRLLSEGSLDLIRRRLREASWRLVREDDRYRRASKAANAGYRPADEQFYTTGILRTLIPMYLDGGVSERPPQGRELSPGRSSSGASGGGDYLAMMMDLDYAMSAVAGRHRSVLRRYFAFPQGSGGLTHLQIAGQLGIDPESLRLRVWRALGAMQRRLGGRNPWNRRALEYQDSPSGGAG